MTLLEQVEHQQKMCAREANPAEPHMERMAAFFQQIAGWMKTVLTLLGNSRAYVSCDIYSDAPYGPEAKALYEELCHFGAEQPLPDIRWKRGVEEAIKVVEHRIGNLMVMGGGTKPDAVWALKDVEAQLRAMLSRGSYEDKSSTLMGVDEHGNFPPSTKCYHGEDMVGDSEGDGRCDECDGSGVYYIDDKPQPCICSEPQDSQHKDQDCRRCQVRTYDPTAQCLLPNRHEGPHQFRQDTASVWEDPGGGTDDGA